MTKYLFLSILILFFISIISLSAQPKGALAPKERDIEDAPEDSVAASVYLGMPYEELMTVFNGLKNYTTADPLSSLRSKEKELLKIRDMAWRLVLFMEDPIKKRVAEGLARESHRATLLKAVKDVHEAQAAFVEDRESRLKVIDSLSRPEQIETAVEEEATDQDGDGWTDEPKAKEENTTETTETEVKEKGKKEKGKKEKTVKEKTVKEKVVKKKEEKGMDKKEIEKNKVEQTRKEQEQLRLQEKQRIKAKEDEKKKLAEAQQAKETQEREKKEKAKEKQDEKQKAKNTKQQEKFIEKEQAALEAAYEDSTKMIEDLQALEDSMARYTEELKAFEDSTELMRANLTPVKGLSFEIRKEWVKLHYLVLEETDKLGDDAEADFNAVIDDFHNSKIDEVLNTLDNPDFIARIKTLRDNIFLSKKIPNINCNGGIGNFMKGQYLPKEEIEKIWEEIGRQVWQSTEKNKQKTREVSTEEYKAIGRSADCVGYVLGLGDDCNLVILKLIDESKIAIVCKKNKEDDMSAIKIIK